MAANNRDRVIKVAGYVKRVFFNDNIEYRNFNPDLVGLQFTSDGGSALFTMGNFSITTNASPSQFTVFKLGAYSKKYTLDDVTQDTTTVLTIQRNLTAGLNLDITNPLSYIWYGSAEEMFRVSLSHIKKYFPAAIYVDNKVGSVTGNNITNYVYNPETDKTTFDVSTNYFTNPYNIKYTRDFRYKTSGQGATRKEYFEYPELVYDKEVYNEADSDNVLRNFTLNNKKYVIEHNGIIKDIIGLSAATQETNSTISLIVVGNPFPELTGINFSTFSFLNPIYSGSIQFFIKPNEVEQQNFFTSLNPLEKNILNLEIVPKYTMVINRPEFTEEGVLVFTENKITFPLLEDGYNLNFFNTYYLSYLDKVTEYTSYLDTHNTDLILRKYTTDAVSSFDTIPRGDGNDLTLDGEKATKLFRIYGREFDEVKKYINGIKFAHVVTYDKKNNVPDSLVKELALMLGLEGFNFLDNFNIKENVLPTFGSVTYSGISTTLSNEELDIEIYRRLILSLAWTWKSKGARKAVEFLFRFIGAPESLVNFNEYIVMVDKPLDMEKIKKLLFLYTGSVKEVDEILKTIPYDKNGYPLPPRNGETVIVDLIEGPGLLTGQTATTQTTQTDGLPVYFEDYDLNGDGVIDVEDVVGWVNLILNGTISPPDPATFLSNLQQITQGVGPLPPFRSSSSQPIMGNLPGVVISEEREMYFQKAGGWYRETAGAFAEVLVLNGNNPHVGTSIDANGNYSTYDGGSEYLSIFSRCYIPNFNGVSNIVTTATTLYENSFINYNYGIFNGVPSDTPIYTSFLTLDNQLIDDCILVTPTIITTPFNPDGVTTLESIFLQAEAEYELWLEDIKKEPYLRYSPEWERVKNNYKIASNNYNNEINTQQCDSNLSLELCFSIIVDDTPPVGDPCDDYVMDDSNAPYIVFRDPSIASLPIIAQGWDNFSLCCIAAGGQFHSYMTPNGKMGQFCATSAPCSGKWIDTNREGIAVFELFGNVIPHNVYQIDGECYQFTDSPKAQNFCYYHQGIGGGLKFGEPGFNQWVHANHAIVIGSGSQCFTPVECSSTTTISSPDCCAWHNLDYIIMENGDIHCIKKETEQDDGTGHMRLAAPGGSDPDSGYNKDLRHCQRNFDEFGSPTVDDCMEGLGHGALLTTGRGSTYENLVNALDVVDQKIMDANLELKNNNKLTVVEKKKIEADIISNRIDKLYIEKEEKSIIKKQSLTIKPATSKEVTTYRRRANPDGKPDVYNAITVFNQSRNEGTIIQGEPDSNLSSINVPIASSFLDPDLMQTNKWDVEKIDDLGRITFSARDNRGNLVELDWTSTGDRNALYGEVSKTKGIPFQRFEVDRFNNKLVPEKRMAPADNTEYTTAAVSPAYIPCDGIDDIKILFGTNQYSGFYLPINVEGQNSIDISFDYIIKYDAETLWDCVGAHEIICGLPAIFNQNSLENIDCPNFISFLSPTDGSIEIRNDLYDVYSEKDEAPNKVIEYFQQTGLQSEPTLECCEALGGVLLSTTPSNIADPQSISQWVRTNKAWVATLCNIYENLLDDPFSIAIEGVRLEEQQLIAAYINALKRYRRRIDDIINVECIDFFPAECGSWCNTDFYLNLIPTENVCALRPTDACGIYSKILADFKCLIGEINYMIDELKLCQEEEEEIGGIIGDIDVEIIGGTEYVNEIHDNAETEIETVNVEIIDLDDDINTIIVEISDRENDNVTIETVEVDTEPEQDCSIYEAQVENLDNFNTTEFCRQDVDNRSLRRSGSNAGDQTTGKKKEYKNCIEKCDASVPVDGMSNQNANRICKQRCGASYNVGSDKEETLATKAYNECFKEKNAAIQKEKQTYIQLTQECKNVNSLNEQLESAKSKNQTNVVALLEKEISAGENRIDSICEACGGIVITNETIQAQRQAATTQPATIATISKILNTPESNITSKDKLDLSDGDKLKLNIIKNKNIATINNLMRQANELIQIKNEKSQQVTNLETELKYKTKESEDVVDVLLRKKQELEDGTKNNKCCKELLERLEALKLEMLKSYMVTQEETGDWRNTGKSQQLYGLGNVESSTRDCYDQWFKNINEAYNTYMNSSSYSYLNYLTNLHLNFNIEVNNCHKQNCPLNDLDSNMNTTPFGVSNFWEFNLDSNNKDNTPPLISDIFGDAHSGIIIEGNKSQEVITAIYDEITNLLPSDQSWDISPVLFEPEWQTFTYSLDNNMCEVLKACYPGKEFFISIEIENVDCGMCLIIDNIEINTNRYILDQLITGSDCLIPQLTCIIDNKKSWVYTDKGIEVKTIFPDGPCTTGSTSEIVTLTTPQDRLWQELEYRYTDYKVNHSDLIINTKSASISIDPAKAIECDVYDFWKNIDCDSCPTPCTTGETIEYVGSVRETPSDTLTAYTLTLSGSPVGKSFSCETYTTILKNEVDSLKNQYYILTANYNESIAATYSDLIKKGGELENFTIQTNNCNTQTLVIGDYKDIDNLYGLIVEGSDGILSFWESYIFNTTTPYSGGELIDIFSGYTAQTFNQTSGLTPECCSTINKILNGTGKSGLGLEKEYKWNDSVSGCTWMELGGCNNDCEYFGYKDQNNIESGYISDNFRIWFSAGTTTINVMYESDKPIGAYQMILLNNAGTPILPNLIGVGGGDSGAAGFLGTFNNYQFVQTTLSTTILPPSSGVLIELTFASPITTIFNDYNGEILDRMRIASTTISHNGTGQGADVTGDGNYNVLDLVMMVNNLLITPTLEGVGNGTHGNMSGDDGVENIYGLVWAILTMSAPWNVPPTDSFSNYEDIIGINTICKVSEVPICINPIEYLDVPPSDIEVKQVFDEMVLSNLIDAKDRQTISGYPLLQLFYQLYLTADNCGKDLTGKLTYNNLFEYMEKIGDYWLDLIEQVVPATTIWEGCETSGKIYRNTIFDQDKFVYKKYSLKYIDIPTDCSSVAGVTSNSIGESSVDIQIIENCRGGACLGDEYSNCMQEVMILEKQLLVIENRMEFINFQLGLQDAEGPILCNLTEEEQQDLYSELMWLENQKTNIEVEKTNKETDCKAIENQIIAANANLLSVTNNCSGLADKITEAQTKLDNLEKNTLPYEKQKNYLAVLRHTYNKCIRSTTINISQYNTVFITQMYDSNEFEGNVRVYGDDEYDGQQDANADGILEPAGLLYNTELIHNCDD